METTSNCKDATFSPMRLLTLQTRLSAAYKGIMALMMKKGGNDFISGDQIEITNYFGIMLIFIIFSQENIALI